jgi:hypothetical protein
MTNYLNTQNQDNLLFKQFQGVVQANINAGSALVQYSKEQRKALKNIFNSSIFSNDVPIDLSNNYWVVNLDNSGSITPSQWVGSSGSNRTVGQMQNIGKFEIPGTNGDLTFYKQVYLEPVAATNQAWYCRDPSSSNPTSFSTENNLLKDMIPYLYNDVNQSTYTPIVYYNSGTIASPVWNTQQQNVPNSLNWVLDPASGVLQFYQSDTILNGLNIDKTKIDSSGNPIEGGRPRISFIKYTGPKGASGGGSGGGISDASYNELVGDISANTAAINDLSNNIADDGNLNKYLFEIPEAPTNGSFNSISGQAAIELTWTNPPQKRAALDFYQNIEQQFDTINTVDPNLADDLQNRMNYLPFHQNIKLQYRSVSPTNQVPPSGWPNLPASTQYPWIDASNANISGVSPVISGPIFKDITKATFNKISSPSTSEAKQDLSSTPNTYTNTNNLNSQKLFQFRIAQVNKGFVDDNIPHDNSWNYLYLPDVSNQYIQLGTFGPPEIPNTVSFINTTYESAEITGNTINDADASLNTPFPISYPASTLAVKYQFDLSGSPAVGALQQPANQNSTIFDVSFVSNPTQQNNFQSQLKYSSPNWNGTTNPIGRLTELDVYPEHTYELDGSFCMYNIINNVDNPTTFDPSCVQIIDVSFTSLRPTRAQANETGNTNSEIYFDQQSSNTLSFTNNTLAKTNPIASNGTIYSNVYFINNTANATFTLDNEYYTQDNNDNKIGIDANSIPCSKYTFDCSENIANVTDVSVNTFGYSHPNGITPDPIPIGTTLDTSNNDFKIKIFNNDIGSGQKKGGYYTFVRIEDNSDTQFIVSQNKYPDSSNNLYQPYNIKIRQEYNTQPPGSEAWIPAGEKSFPFRLGWEPAQTQFQLISTNVNNPNTIRDFFGLKRPDSNPSVDIEFNINNRNLWWRGSTTEYTTISTTKLWWNKTINNSYVEFDSQSESWVPNSNWPNSQTVNETLPIDINLDLGKTTTNSNSYCRKGVSSTTSTPLDQFKISLDYANNVPLTSPLTQYDENTNTQPLDISFNNLLLFWDFTWKGNVNWISGGTLNGPGLDSTGGFYPDNSGNFGSPYEHNADLSFNQLMWTGEDTTTSLLGAFRNGNHGNNNENPYINYSSTFFDNPYNYSTLDTSGETVSITYSKNGNPGDYYADPIGLSNSSVISGTYKWFVLEIEKGTTDGNKINVTVQDHAGNDMILGDDYLLFICEAGSQFTLSNSPYVGRTGWKDAARKFDSQLGAITQNSNGTGIYLNGGSGNLQLFTPSNTQATLYLRIGLANKDSTNNTNIGDTTTLLSIGSVSWEFS